MRSARRGFPASCGEDYDGMLTIIWVQSTVWVRYVLIHNVEEQAVFDVHICQPVCSTPLTNIPNSKRRSALLRGSDDVGSQRPLTQFKTPQNPLRNVTVP